MVDASIDFAIFSMCYSLRHIYCIPVNVIPRAPEIMYEILIYENTLMC